MARFALIVLAFCPLLASAVTTGFNVGGLINDAKSVGGAVGVTVAPNMGMIGGLLAQPGNLINGTVGTAAYTKAQIDYIVTNAVCKVVTTILQQIESVLSQLISQSTGVVGTVGDAVAGAGNAVGPVSAGLDATATAAVIASVTKIVAYAASGNAAGLMAAMQELMSVIAGAGAGLNIGGVFSPIGSVDLTSALSGLFNGAVIPVGGAGIAF